MKQCETTKLFYDRYKYKLVILNALGYIFRHKKLSHARSVLDTLQRQDDAGEKLEVTYGFRCQRVTPEVFLENKRLHSQFVKASDYKIRIERTIMSIYSNDLTWIKTLSEIAESPIELWKPNKEHEDIINEANVILTRTIPDFEYKVTFSTTEHIDPGLASWIEANPDKAKATDACLKHISQKRVLRGQFFYVRDEKVLRLIDFMIGKTGRVDKLVYVGDVDK